MTHRVVVIGFGNTIRGDDALGVVVVRSLRERLEQEGDPRLLQGTLALHTAPMLETGREEELACCSAIILVDAWEGGEDVLTQEVLAESKTSTLTSHVCSPELLAALIETLYGRRPAIFLVAVPGNDFTVREGISAEAEASVQIAVNAIVGIIDRIHPIE